MTAGVYHSVFAARYRYHLSKGLCCGLAEVFVPEYNTFYTAEGEMSLDLWSLHQLSGLQIDGEPYEEVCLPDIIKDRTGGGQDCMGYSYRYLMKVYRQLSLARNTGRSRDKRESLHMRLAYFFSHERRYEDFVSTGGIAAKKNPGRQKVTILDSLLKGRLSGPNLVGADPHTHCAAYLAYWICSFALPVGDDSLLRPDVIYPACQMAWGIKLSLCPTALCLIYRSLGDLCRRSAPRQHRVIGPWHFLSVWACGLFPEFAPRSLQLTRLFPRMLEFASVEPHPLSKQLFEIRGKLTSIPTDSPGTIYFCHLASHSSPLANRYRECRDDVIEDFVHPTSRQRLTRSALEPELRDWALSIRPSVLTFARNFGYDQHIPPSSANFNLTSRAVGGGQLLDQACKWWDFFHRFDSSTFRVPMPGRTPRVTPEYIKWWNARTRFYREYRTDCWDAAERKLLQLQPQPVLDIDSEHLLRLKSGDRRAVDRYLKAREAAKKRNPPPTLVLSKVEEDTFPATLEHLCNISSDRLAVAQPWPIEEAAPTTVSQRGEIDREYPYWALSVRGDPGRDRYAYTSWLFVLLHVHNLTVEADYESILAHELHMAGAWTTSTSTIFLSSVGQADLAIFAEDCCHINDVCWLIQEAASRAKQSAHTFWPLSRFYTGIADPSAKDRQRRYHGLIMKVKRPSYFAEEKILYKPLTEKLSAKKSSIASSIARAQRASKRKREASPLPSISTEGPSIPSFEEFCNEREDAACTDMAVDSPVVRTVDERPTKKAVARRVKKPPVPFRTSQRAAGRAALLKIRQGGRAIALEELQKPVAISSDESSSVETVYGSPSPSGSLSDDGSLFRVQKRERISALDGIAGDSSSSGEKSHVVTSRPEATISSEHVLDFEGVQDTNTPESSPTVGVDLSNIGEPALDPLSIDEVQGVAKEPAPEVEVSLPLALSGDSTSPLQAPTTQLVDTISGKEVAISEAAVTPATSGGALNVSSTGASLSSAGLASCSTVVDASLWAEVDAQVEFQVPGVGPSGDFCSSDAMVQGQLSSLRTLVRQNPAIPYERVKAAADQMTGVLVIMGCSLDEWANRVTLLLKLLKHRDYLQHELSDQMNALEIQQSDCKAVLNPLADNLEHCRSLIRGYDEESTALDSKIHLLEAELHAANARRDTLADLKAEQELAIAADEDRLTLAK
ncbi:hypothetical protein Taro_015257 [Colocasia esculenta]|uniref:Aminotransferase-like plant mobile domain-containing protein n=1 Tax=Colocasia esculenta TaxID=4460 RepID=A0A843USL8_COLES|nr:hypothetical protein [Colocasia esculenta]